MLISLAFIFLLTPYPSLQASIGERKNSTKPTHHTISHNVTPKPVTSLNVKAKTQSSPAASKVSNATQTPYSSTKPAGTANVQKPPNDTPPSSSTITVIISEGCVQKDTVNSTKVQEIELSVKPGSTLVMTHRINLEISTCTEDCEAEVETLKGRVEFLEKEVFALKKKCALCSDEPCLNDCSGRGKCEGGKCVCQHGFTGPDCSKGADKKSKLTVETVAMKASESDTVTQDSLKKPKADQTILEKKVDDKEEKTSDKNVWTTARPSTIKPVTTTSSIKDHYNETKIRKEAQLSQTSKRQEQATRGKDTTMKVTSDKLLNTDPTVKLGTKPDSAEKLSIKQDKLKDMPVNQNLTQSPEKKLNGTKVLSRLSKVTKPSVNVTAKASSGKGKPSKSNMTSTENNKKIQASVTAISKGGSAIKQKVEKHGNATFSVEKDKKLHQANVTLVKDGTTSKKTVAKHVNISSSTEKDKGQLQVNTTFPKEGKKKVHSSLNVTTSSEKDKKLVHSNVTTVLTGVKRKVDNRSNVTVSHGKDEKTLSHGNETLKEVSSSKKKVEKQVNVTSSTEKDKKPLPVNVTLLKEETPGRKKIEKHINVATSSEKDKVLHQGNVTIVKEGLPGKKKADNNLNATISNEKTKKIPHGTEATPLKEITPGRKKVEKHINVTTSIDKDQKHHQVNITPLKEETSGRKRVEKHVNITAPIEKDKKPPQVNVTLLKEEASGKKKVNTITVSDDKNKKLGQSNSKAGLREKVESQVNTTHSITKDKALRQGSDISKEGAAKKKKVTSGADIMVSTEKDKKFFHRNETASLKEVTSGRKKVEKHVNVTSSIKKDKKQPEVNGTAALKESMKKKVDTDVNITVSEAKTSKLKDIRSVEIHNITATGFIMTWEAPQGAFRNFTVTRREVLAGSKDEDITENSGKSQEGQVTTIEDEADILTSNRTSKVQTGKPDRKSAKKFSQVLSGTARSFHFRNLQPQTRYLASLYSSGSGGPSKLHRLFVSTGPEPPSDLMFSNITETSLSVSWTKPKSIVTGFKVTYTNTGNGETGSISVDSQLSHVLISKLSAGSSYELTARSVLETMESEPTTASVVTVPDPPIDLQAVNITDSRALLTWKPSQAKVDHYILSYGSAKSPNVTVTVMLSGSSVEHKMRGLHRFTLYTVKIISQINNLQSRSISTTFTTTSGVKPQTVTPNGVTFRSAVILWKAPRLAFRSYRLTYQHGEDIKEIVLNPSVTSYELTGLAASSNYSVKVDGESEGQYINIVSTAFTTAQVPYLYPSDCSQVQQNGMKESGEAEVYPDGKDGEPVWVYCDMDTDGGGWTVFQRRVDGSTDFFRSWKDYSKGFGFLSTEFWLGNDILHSLTSLAPMSLRIDLHYGNDTAFAKYSNFTVGSEANHYTITLSGYSGTAGDSMRYHNGRPFSTKDKDPDTLSIHCAKAYMGGWWYKNCYKANLNGLYATFSENQGVVWIDWKGKDISIPFTEMKLRPASLSLMSQN